MRWEVQSVVFQRTVKLMKHMALVAHKWTVHWYIIYGCDKTSLEDVSPKMQCCNAWQTVTVIPEELSASNFSASVAWILWVDYKGPEDGISKFFWNIRNYLPTEMGSYSGRHLASSTPVWEYWILKYQWFVSCCETTNIYILTTVRILDINQCCTYFTYNRCDWNVVYKEYRVYRSKNTDWAMG